jgi:Ca-activated chloride channel homolog
MTVLFRSPTLLWGLAAVPVLAVLIFLSLRRRDARLRAFGDEKLLPRLAPDVDRRRRTLRAALRLTGFALLAVAVAGPKWGFHWEEVHREGIDLIVAIDTSRSMLATDVKPDRLERAKLAVLDMVKLLEGDRIGLVAFAGTAFLECPLTLDYAAFERSLRSLQVGIIPRGGTALGRAIAVSLDGFEARQGKHEALVLITDGEDHEGNVEEAAQAAADHGVRIYTVGIGTAEGELIPLTQEGARAFVKDREGQVVKSRLNEDTLRQIAMKSNGAYVRGVGAALGLDEVFREHIAKMERREVASTLERRYEERFQFPLLLALLCFFLEGLAGDRKSVRNRRGLWARLRRPRPGVPAQTGGAMPEVTTLLLLLAAAPFLTGFLDRPGDRVAEGNRLYEAGKYAEAVGKYGEGLVDEPQSSLLRFNLAAGLYKEGKYAEAATEWSKLLAEGDPQWVGRAAYNLGNAQYRLGANAADGDPQAALSSYEQALAFYKRAMTADPGDADPKFNHELVAKRLEELKKRIEEERKKKEQEQEQQKQDQQQQQEQQPDQQPQAGEQTPQSEAQAEPTPGQEQAQGEQAPPEEPTPGEEQQTGQNGESEQRQQQEAAQQPAAGAPQTTGAPEEAAGEPNADQQAAQAILDTAQGEELGPEDVRRATGIATVGEPAQDW